jgi:hypothetical protein
VFGASALSPPVAADFEDIASTGGGRGCCLLRGGRKGVLARGGLVQRPSSPECRGERQGDSGNRDEPPPGSAAQFISLSRDISDPAYAFARAVERGYAVGSAAGDCPR